MYLSRHFHFLLLLSLLTFINACSHPNRINGKKNVEPLVSAQWLNAHLNDSDMIVLDTSVVITSDGNGGFSQESGRNQYIAGHIPTAGFADLLGDLSAKSDNDYVMPEPQHFKQAIEKLGVGDDSVVVLYSAKNHVWATRVWWMLKWAGFDNVAILDGGLGAWKAEDFPLSIEIPKQVIKTFTLNLRPELIAHQAEVLASIENNDVDIIDAMPSAHYQGQFSMYPRTGHILSASNVPTSDLIDEFGLFKPIEKLKSKFEGYTNNRVITYCGGGVAATSVAFNLYRLGYSDVAVYMGSLNEWIVNPNNPMTIKGN